MYLEITWSGANPTDAVFGSFLLDGNPNNLGTLGTGVSGFYGPTSAPGVVTNITLTTSSGLSAVDPGPYSC